MKKIVVVCLVSMGLLSSCKKENANAISTETGGAKLIMQFGVYIDPANRRFAVNETFPVQMLCNGNKANVISATIIARDAGTGTVLDTKIYSLATPVMPISH